MAIGAIRAREMRNTSILSIAVFLAACWPLATLAGNPGLWLAFVVYVCARAAALRLYYPALRRSIAPVG